MEPSSAKVPSKSLASLPQELDDLYGLLRGAPYVTALVEAKKRFQAKDYVETLRLVRNTGDLHHRAHLQLLQQDPRTERKSKEEIEKISAKQAKLKGVLALFDEVAEKLEKLARVQPDEPQVLVSPKPQKPIEAPLAPSIPRNSEGNSRPPRATPRNSTSSATGSTSGSWRAKNSCNRARSIACGIKAKCIC